MASKSLPDSVRSRQAQLYYEGWQRVQERLHADPDNLQANAFAVTEPGRFPRSSQDRALTAFAQLTAIKLSCKRAFVTIVGRDVEYILAEATQSLSLALDTTHTRGDQMLIGRQVLENKKSLGLHVFNAEYRPSDLPEDAEPLNALVVHDCFEDEMLRENGLVRQYNVRFLISAPIKTPSGICIGTLTAISNEPRAEGGISCENLRFLQDTSDTIFQHLDLSKGHIDGIQGADMVHQLSSFITQSGLRGRKTTSLHSSASEGQSRKKASLPQKIASISDFELKTTFARAANYLRTAVSADGCIFLDAGSATSAADDHLNNVGLDVDSQENTNESGYTSAGDSSNTSAASEISNDASVKQSTQQSTATIIAGDIDEGNRQSGSSASSFSLLDSEIRHLITTYPQGKVFNFHDRHYIPTSSDPESSDTTTTPINAAAKPRNSRKEGRATRAGIAETVISSIPNVTIAIFLPLWDFGQERWHSCAVLWTTQIGQMMDPTRGMPYLKAFADSIMSEVSRVDALRQDHAKTNFIASISHELRSPLHGMLGGIEFFNDTELDFSQRNLLASIESCGKTLKETIDHVLDFAKINSKGAFSGKRDRTAKGTLISQRRNPKASNVPEGESSFDLSILVEDVVEAVAAGQTLRGQNETNISDSDWLFPPETTVPSKGSVAPWSDDQAATTSEDTVALVLDVTRSQDWKVRSYPGAIRRIVMNLFGNAMKYTTRGEIYVLVRPKQTAISMPGRITIEIIVRDTGRGLTSRYLRERLYKPFAQEDPFSSGMGLGLHIVKQLVEFLSGKIGITSEPGRGTEITVTLTLPLANEISGEDSSELLGLAVKPWAGHSCCVIDLSAPEATNQNSASLVQRSMHGILANTFSLSVSESNSVPAQFNDLLVLLQNSSNLQALSANLAKIVDDPEEKPRQLAIIVLCANQYEARRVDKLCVEHLAKLGSAIEVITQPLAPKKLATALRRCAKVFEGGSSDWRMNGTPLPTNVKINLETEIAKPSEQETSIGSKLSSAPQVTAPDPASEQLIAAEKAVRNGATKEQGRILAVKTSSDSLVVKTLSESQTNSDPPVHKDDIPLGPFVLLVDDNDINLRLLVMLMQKIKTRYVSAVNGLEALNVYKSHSASGNHIDLIFMDISMPIMDGIKSTELIRRYEQENLVSKAMIIALSGLGSEQAQAKAKLVGFDDYIRKPANMKVLRKVIEDWKHTDRNEGRK